MKPGSSVRVTTKNGLVLEGSVLPGDELVLKLDDGYNIGIAERNIEKVQTLKKPEQEKKSSSAKVQKKKSLPKVLLLHTGGTIASKVDYETGGTSNLIKPDELLSMYPELQKVAQLEAQFLANMSTEDFRFAHFNIIAKGIADAVKKGYKGVIVTTGTDLMHSASAAMHYMLQHIPIPVVFTGAQRSADRGSSDASGNLLGALQFITQLKVPGVYLAMHEGSSDDAIAVYRGINVRKMHTARRDAFKSINVPQVARVTKEGATLLKEPKRSKGKFSHTNLKENLRIGMLYVHPQLFPEELHTYQKFDGLIIMGTGLGAAPITAGDKHTKIHEEIHSEIQSLAQKMPVVMCSQCINGRVSLQVYSSNRKLQDLGVYGHDLALSPETLFIKLAWILSQGRDAKDLHTDFDDTIPRTEEGVYE